MIAILPKNKIAMQFTTKKGQIIPLVITSTPKNIPTGKPFVHPTNPEFGFCVKNIGTEAIPLKVIGVDDTEAVSTTFYPGWNVEFIKMIAEDAPANLQWGE